MKFFIKPALLFTFFIFLVRTAAAQDLASAYHPKNKTERHVIEKIRALPEVKDFFKLVQKDKPDFIINPPNATYNNCYGMQIGIDYGDSFRTHFWLMINPKTMDIYYWDILQSDQFITLQQWRYWRTKPGFKKPHLFKHGKLVVLKDDKTKGGHP
jgi:hypothetical protein